MCFDRSLSSALVKVSPLNHRARLSTVNTGRDFIYLRFLPGYYLCPHGTTFVQAV